MKSQILKAEKRGICILHHFSAKGRRSNSKVHVSLGVNRPACAAFTEHGFRGKEKEVMNAITAIIKTGKASQLDID
jgi:hypothetical protein